MILDMQGGFKTEERGGVEVKVRIRQTNFFEFFLEKYKSDTRIIFIQNYFIKPNEYLFYRFIKLYFQGKGLLQTFWLIEEKRIEKIEPERKTKAKRDRDNE